MRCQSGIFHHELQTFGRIAGSAEETATAFKTASRLTISPVIFQAERNEFFGPTPDVQVVAKRFARSSSSR